MAFKKIKTVYENLERRATRIVASTVLTLGLAAGVYFPTSVYLGRNNATSIVNQTQAVYTQSSTDDEGIDQTIEIESARKIKQNKLEKTLEISQESDSTNIEIKERNYPNPTYTKDDNFASDTDTMILARALYGEARGQIETDQDYVYGVARSIINRSKKSGETIKEILIEKNKKKLKSGKIIDVYAYSCFDPKDKNLSKIKNPDKELFGKCYTLAEQAIEGTYTGNQSLENATNYFVSKSDPSNNLTRADAIKKNIPGWAYEMKDGKFIKDAEGKRIPRKPTSTINLSNGRTARFYSFKQF